MLLRAVLPPLLLALNIVGWVSFALVRLFAGDGITIPQISDMFEWGQMALAGWSVGSDASRQMEAMQAMMLTHKQMSHNDQDIETPCLYMFIPGVAGYIASQLYSKPQVLYITYCT